MPRPISWLPRLHEIQRSVSSSVRSHYQRKDLEALFEIQPRAAQLLMDLFPTTQVGRSRLVEREVLLSFLHAILQAEDVPAAIEAMRRARRAPSRSKLRVLVQHDQPLASLTALPANLTLEPGRLEIRFLTIQDLAQTLYSLSQIMHVDLDAFAAAYEIMAPHPFENNEEKADTEVLRQVLGTE
jgi:hypothetical protein